MNLFESRGLLLKYQENKAMSSMIKDMVPHLSYIDVQMQ